MNTYEPAKFWDGLLSKNFDLRATGHASYGLGYNQVLYRAKTRCLRKLWQKENISLDGQDVLELACGVGYFTSLFRDLNARVVGVDISPTSITTLRERFPDVEFKQADISQPGGDLFAQCFPQIYALDVLYHIVDDDRFRQALENIGTWCQPGGTLFLSDGLNSTTLVPDVPVPHVKFRSLSEYKQALEPLGFRLVVMRPMYHFLNRPLIGNRFPWTNQRIARFLRRRVCENLLVRNGLYWLDVVKLAMSWRAQNLKIAVWRKES